MSRSDLQNFREYPDGKKWRSTPAIAAGVITGATPGDE